MEELVYNNEIIKLHHLHRRWGETLRKLPHGGSQFKYDIACLDMDDYEKNQHKSQEGKTMDAVIGVEDYYCNTPKGWLMLVELKLDTDTGTSVKREDCVGKVNHTMEILDDDDNVYHIAFFVFPNDIVPKYIIKFTEWNKGSNHSRLKLQCVGIGEFNNAVKPEKSDEELSLIPDTISNDLLSLAANNDLSEFWQKEEFWFNKFLTYCRNSQRTEARSIAEGIRRALAALSASHNISKHNRKSIDDVLKVMRKNLHNTR